MSKYTHLNGLSYEDRLAWIAAKTAFLMTARMSFTLVQK